MALETKFPWWPAGLLVAGVLLLAMLLVHPPVAPPVAPSPAGESVLSLVQAGNGPEQALLKERFALDDKRVLFLPNELSSSTQSNLAASPRPEASILAVEFPPKFEAGTVEQKISERPPLPSGPITALNLTERADEPLAFGQTEHAADGLPARFGVIEAVAAGSGELQWTVTLTQSPGAEAPTGDWAPLELQGIVAPSGLVGGLIVTRNSPGHPQADEFFTKWLAQDLRVGERLPPGTYFFRVGP